MAKKKETVMEKLADLNKEVEAKQAKQYAALPWLPKLMGYIMIPAALIGFIVLASFAYDTGAINISRLITLLIIFLAAGGFGVYKYLKKKK